MLNPAQVSSAKATTLYNNIAIAIPVTALLFSSLRTSQHAIPSDNKAAPARRPINKPIGLSTDESNNIETGRDGDINNKIPVTDSNIPVTMSKFFIDIILWYSNFLGYLKENILVTQRYHIIVQAGT